MRVTKTMKKPKRNERGQFLPKKNSKDKGHFVRLSPSINQRLAKMDIKPVQIPELCRLALTAYLDTLEKTSDRPPLPPTIKRPKIPRINFDAGEQVETDEGRGTILSVNSGWYRVEVGQEVLFKRASDLRKVNK